MTDITIYHNPSCGTSRNTLALIRNTGVEPEVIEYLKMPPSREKLAELIRQMNIPARQLLRDKEALYEELNLADASLTDNELIDAMLAHPTLINRPIVVTSLGVRLCRPAERVREILPLPKSSAPTKEDGG
jgi:arsenate reductase (glutaredoxin)